MKYGDPGMQEFLLAKCYEKKEVWQCEKCKLTVEPSIEALALFTLSTQGASTFVFTQGASALTWNINHNLGRFPSITVIDTANTIVTGEYTYIDDNNVTLNFSAQFAGKAYLN